MKRGKFIAIEGTDGSGKATQAALLVQALRKKGRRVHMIAFPQHGEQSAGAVDAYLNGVYGTPKEVGTYRAAIFYAVDRAAARKKILSWLGHGDDVIADRYVASNWAFGGALLPTLAARKKYWRWDTDLEFGLFSIPKPDRMVILAVPSGIAQKLVLKKQRRGYLRGRKRDLHERDTRYQARVLRVYRQLPAFDRSIRLVECAEKGRLLTIQDVHQRVMAALQGLV